ncbi:hypothetical protein EDEG_02967 [Edhazardia aedis USNM 41457]|uniref:Uncharacterized protein n=1 Tax=Edhazardia aedis (strain USNM 41457) TaxID=1003232 RepID=J9DMT0_EDHAE|nr:hypothetical protein EDEG_02967 [Edhazardia aedis USNM 41457]|eukprot:EJW02647.1 hypothetical protein EDEG_02967 [Edhazardia aedis USNM 41457]
MFVNKKALFIESISQNAKQCKKPSQIYVDCDGIVISVIFSVFTHLTFDKVTFRDNVKHSIRNYKTLVNQVAHYHASGTIKSCVLVTSVTDQIINIANLSICLKPIQFLAKLKQLMLKKIGMVSIAATNNTIIK